MTSSAWDKLPDEIVLQILSHLEPYLVSRLQRVSKRLRELCLDDELWKRHCFQESPWYQGLIARRYSRRVPFFSEQGAAVNDETGTPRTVEAEEAAKVLHQRNHRAQDMANWDPAFPDEKLAWYDEYIQRSGPTSVNWLEAPTVQEGGIEALLEAHGVGLYSPNHGEDGEGTLLAVSPLEDGSVCLWDVKGTRGKRGGILSMSKEDLLFTDGQRNKDRSKLIDSSISDRVSVNNHGHKAFFAVQSHLVEVDLNRLSVVSREQFEWTIMTLSPVHEGVPLTVGTSLGIHLHDFRAKARVSHEVVERVDGQNWDDMDALRAIFDRTPPPPYASLSQATPSSILHLPRQGSSSLVTDDIYVSGRFSNLLHYDRRKFPVICGSIYSGALINSLAALPYSFSKADHDMRQQGELSFEQLASSKAQEGQTLIAGGGYNQKGSLELYGLCPDATGHMTMPNSLKNRYTAASSTILSVANHGTKIVFSDGSGLLKWFERDGSTECRRLRIGHSQITGESSIFESMPGSDDVARKILSTKMKTGDEGRPNDDNILFWTGERLGMVSFTPTPLYSEKTFEVKDPETSAEDEARQEYADRMREALERSADEVRFMGSLGLR